MRNKFPLATKGLSQADCFEMSNFDVLEQIHGSRVIQVPGVPQERSSEGESSKLLPSWQQEGARGEEIRPKKWIPGWF